MKKVAIALLLSFCLVTPLFAQKKLIRFKHMTSDQGLSQATVTTILKDRQGFMWFGTADGLNRYDGYEFRIYKNDHSDSLSIGGNHIICALEDSTGILWFGTWLGLSRYDRNRDCFRNYYHNPKAPSGLGKGRINAICSGTKGNIWIGTGSDGLQLLTPQTCQFKNFQYDSDNPASLGSNDVRALLRDSKGNLWMGTSGPGETGGGLNLLAENGTFKRWLHDPQKPRSIPSDKILKIAEDSFGNIWVGSRKGLSRIIENNGEVEFEHYQNVPGQKNGLSNNSILSLFPNKKGLWIGTENNGIDFFDVQTGQFTNYANDLSNSASLNNNSVYSLLEDESGNLWAGTYSGGLNFASATNQAFRLYRHNVGSPATLSYDSVTDFCEDNQGVIWLATDGGGLNRFDKATERFEHYDMENSNLSRNAGLCVLSDSYDDIWLGTWNGGLNKFNRETRTFEVYTSQNAGLPTNKIFALFEDSKKRFWVNAFRGGLVLFDRKEGIARKVYRPEDHEMSSSSFKFIVEDEHGNLLFGTPNGLHIFNPEKENFVVLTRESHALSDNDVTCVLHETGSRFFIGTKNGLNLYDFATAEIRYYFKSDGLPNNTIRAMVKDNQGDIWIATNMGLAQLDVNRQTFKNYGKADGLQGNEFNTRSAFRSRDGFLWFGGVNGFNVFDPRDVRDNVTPPPVVLVDFKIFNKPVPVGSEDSPLHKPINHTQEITLSYKESVFSFDYAALDFVAPEENSYAYRLDGFEEEWNYVGNKRNATYTNMDPGEYIFRVKASNNDGYWNEEGVAVKLRITPPFWATTWFRIAAGLSLLFGILFIYKMRVRGIKAQNRKLEEQVARRTNELKEKNQKLITTLDELKQTRQQLVESAHSAGMADVAIGVLHNVGNILNSVITSTAILRTKLESPTLARLAKASGLLRENMSNIEDFIANNPKGKKLLEFFLKIEESWREENRGFGESIIRLEERVNAINVVLRQQQEYAKSKLQAEALSLRELVDEALQLEFDLLSSHGIKLSKNIGDNIKILAQRSKVAKILLVLIKNAEEAMRDTASQARELKINVVEADTYIHLRLTDNGQGIKKEELKSIFQQGFHSGNKIYASSLHNCANQMSEMGGRMWAESAGEGHGATFVLEFPCEP